jgi:ubiquinone/menaquinone biosynthesis C-methylase UbiE
MNSPGNYFGQDRQELLQFVPNGVLTLVDVGCGEGFFAAAVKRARPACEVWGLEPAGAAAAQARTRCDRFIQAPFEDSDDIPSAYFDAVTMNDVLEHLPCTESALRLAKRMLKPTGTLVLSLPNVAYYLNVRDLVIHNDWEYRDFGILDRTHLRFFTEKSARRTIEANGFSVRLVQGINEAVLKPHYRLLFAILGKMAHPMRFPQFAVVAQP